MSRSPGRALSLVAMVIVTGALPMSSAAQKSAPLRVGMIPDAGATQVSFREKAPLQAYLSRKLGREVELVIPTNYNATVEALGNGSLDVAYLGGLTFVKANTRYGAVPLVQRDIDQRFHSFFITRPGARIAKLADLKGKSFCFGDINSTSGHLIPQLTLKRAGLNAKRDLASVRYTGSHPATAQAVATGACDAGALDETVYRDLLKDGKIAAGKTQIFVTTQPFADYVWAARKGLPASARTAFSNALLALKPGRDDGVLEILRGKKYVPAKAASYANIRATAKELNLL